MFSLKIPLTILLLCCFLMEVRSAKGVWSRDYEKPYSNLVYGGQEGTDPFPTFVCRVYFDHQASNDSRHRFYSERTPREGSSLVPGKFVPKRGVCYVAFEKDEIGYYNDFEVLITNRNKKYRWIASDGFIRYDAIEGGFTHRGVKLFICRSPQVKVGKFFWKGRAVLVGNTAADWDICFAPWYGKTSKYNEYEYLVMDD